MSNPERADTTMVHLLLGLDPMSLSRSPYIPVVNNPGILTAQDIGLHINPLAPVRLGNSSGEGARQVLLSQPKRREAEALAARITYFELNTTLWTNSKAANFYPTQTSIATQASKRACRPAARRSSIRYNPIFGPFRKTG